MTGCYECRFVKTGYILVKMLESGSFTDGPEVLACRACGVLKIRLEKPVRPPAIHIDNDDRVTVVPPTPPGDTQSNGPQ